MTIREADTTLYSAMSYNEALRPVTGATCWRRQLVMMSCGNALMEHDEGYGEPGDQGSRFICPLALCRRRRARIATSWTIRIPTWKFMSTSIPCLIHSTPNESMSEQRFDDRHDTSGLYWEMGCGDFGSGFGDQWWTWRFPTTCWGAAVLFIYSRHTTSLLLIYT